MRALLPVSIAILAVSVAVSSSLAQGVSYERLRNAADEPGNWLMYSGQYDAQRYSLLDEIDVSNVSGLELKWVRQLNTLSSVETTPLVVDGIMYATLPDNVVMAIDARTGQVFWEYQYPLPEALTLCCGKQSRGVAILGETLFLGTLDAHMVALDANTGTVLWDVEVADGLAGHSITAAPLVVKDMVLTGVAGGEYGIRGFIDAYDVRTGKRRWRAHTIPGEGEPGNDTWEGDSWKTGGAPTWVTGTFDPELNLVYWGTGNPGPDWNGDAREGDNLYSDSVLALDADSGELKWAFQFTPHDVHDWDACQIPVLADVEFGGEMRKVLLMAQRNAFFYAIDRENGEFLRGTEFAKQTWAEGLDENGRPIRVPDMLPSEDGTVVFPSINGAANWWSPAFNPETGLFYAMSFDGSDTYYIAEAEYREGELFVGGYGRPSAPTDTFTSAVRALDPETGERVWQYEVQSKSTSGLLTTAGNLVFGGTVAGTAFALEAETGEELWRQSVGGNVHAGPTTYLVDGKQQVTIAAGHALFTFGLRE
ncbi:MAG: PQQ-dependent dehydrogenase, methanol/ethanol family [Acidobacteriota bacterium]|nr:PQQ-dependent dehydrogenase, methanol/ethanol family [Acidobacteriota bacterium]